ncbi:MAG: VOC family protein [Actinomycetota bacterium]
MRLDHLSYAAGAEGLASCVQRLGSRLGAGFTDGGLHPGFGTRNFVLPMAGGCYVEVVEALDHPAADTAPFGRAVKARAEAGGGWLGWVIGVDDIAVVESRLGRSSVDGHRRRPDGFDLLWRQVGLADLAEDPQRPFFIQWLTDAGHHPSVGAGTVALTELEIAGAEHAVEQYLGVSTLHLLDGVRVQWLQPGDEGTGMRAATFTTAAGPVRID